MAGKLLILTFHGPPKGGDLTGADIHFKRAALASGLIDGDAMDQTAAKNFLTANLTALSHDPKGDRSNGLDLVIDGDRVVTLNRVGGNAWRRPAFVRPKDPQNPDLRLKSVFEQWLDLVFATPVEVLVLGGHHENAALWGAEDKRVTTRHRWYTALLPENVRVQNVVHSTLAVRGHALNITRDDFSLLRAGPFDLTAKGTLKPCRMMVILGCNGAVKASREWRKWMESASDHGAPWIFGWYGVHDAPPDHLQEFIGDMFWPKLKAIAPGTNLDFLHEEARYPAIAKAWLDAADEAFSLVKGQRNLFYSDKSKKNRGPRGVACIDPNGLIRFIKDAAGGVGTESL